MEEEIIAQTKFDQLISDDQSQMLQSFYPLSFPERPAASLRVHQNQRTLKHPGIIPRQTA